MRLPRSLTPQGQDEGGKRVNRGVVLHDYHFDFVLLNLDKIMWTCILGLWPLKASRRGGELVNTILYYCTGELVNRGRQGWEWSLPTHHCCHHPSHCADHHHQIISSLIISAYFPTDHHSHQFQPTYSIPSPFLHASTFDVWNSSPSFVFIRASALLFDSNWLKEWFKSG